MNISSPFTRNGVTISSDRIYINLKWRLDIVEIKNLKLIKLLIDLTITQLSAHDPEDKDKSPLVPIYLAEFDKKKYRNRICKCLESFGEIISEQDPFELNYSLKNLEPKDYMHVYFALLYFGEYAHDHLFEFDEAAKFKSRWNEDNRLKEELGKYGFPIPSITNDLIEIVENLIKYGKIAMHVKFGTLPNRNGPISYNKIKDAFKSKTNGIIYLCLMAASCLNTGDLFLANNIKKGVISDIFKYWLPSGEEDKQQDYKQKYEYFTPLIWFFLTDEYTINSKYTIIMNAISNEIAKFGDKKDEILFIFNYNNGFLLGISSIL